MPLLWLGRKEEGKKERRKMTRENQKKQERGSRRLLALAGILIISLALFSQGCSSRHSITSPFDETESLDMTDSTQNFSFSEEEEEDGGITGAYNQAGSQILEGFSQMLFQATDSLR